MKLLRGTYGNDAVIRTTKGDQISVKLDGQTAVINLDTLVRTALDIAGILGPVVSREKTSYHGIAPTPPLPPLPTVFEQVWQVVDS